MISRLQGRQRYSEGIMMNIELAAYVYIIVLLFVHCVSLQLWPTSAFSSAWCALQVDVAAGRLRDTVVSTAESDLTSQAYWLSATLALGAFLKVCASSPQASTDAVLSFLLVS